MGWAAMEERSSTLKEVFVGSGLYKSFSGGSCIYPSAKSWECSTGVR